MVNFLKKLVCLVVLLGQLTTMHGATDAKLDNSGTWLVGAIVASCLTGGVFTGCRYYQSYQDYAKECTAFDELARDLIADGAQVYEWFNYTGNSWEHHIRVEYNSPDQISNIEVIKEKMNALIKLFYSRDAAQKINSAWFGWTFGLLTTAGIGAKALYDNGAFSQCASA